MPVFPHPPLADATAGQGPPDLMDVLSTSVAAIEARFAVDDSWRIAAIDFWHQPDADPCEVRFSGRLAATAAAGLPAVMDVWRGSDHFATFEIEAVSFGTREDR